MRLKLSQTIFINFDLYGIPAKRTTHRELTELKVYQGTHQLFRASSEDFYLSQNWPFYGSQPYVQGYHLEHTGEKVYKSHFNGVVFKCSNTSHPWVLLNSRIKVCSIIFLVWSWFESLLRSRHFPLLEFYSFCTWPCLLGLHKL